MDTLAIRQMILSTPLQEKPVVVPGWSANLIIRELDGKSGSDLVAACTDTDGKVSQEALVAGIVLATLRNADDANKALVFCKDGAPNVYDPAYRDSLMSTGLGRIMQVANASIDLSGLGAASGESAKNDLGATQDGTSLTS